MEDVATCLSSIPRDFLAGLGSGSLRRGRTELTHNIIRQALAECKIYKVQDPEKEFFVAHELARPCRHANFEIANSHYLAGDVPSHARGRCCIERVGYGEKGRNCHDAER